jgi:superfamily II DNA helicase RecQ
MCRKLLYVTPELIDTQGFLNTLYSLRNNNKLAMFVVDEVRSGPGCAI